MAGRQGRARRHERPHGLDPLPPRRKWRAITIATLLLVPAYWAILAGFVAAASDVRKGAPDPGAAVALGLAAIPFVFILLAFLSEHPRAPSAVVKAMGLALLVGIPASALAADAITGLVAGIGAGGIAALRADEAHNWKSRAWAVAVVSLSIWVLVRVAGGLALLIAPVLPFTSIGVADHLAERKREREASAA